MSSSLRCSPASPTTTSSSSACAPSLLASSPKNRDRRVTIPRRGQTRATTAPSPTIQPDKGRHTMADTSPHDATPRGRHGMPRQMVDRPPETSDALLLDTDVAERRCWRCLKMFPATRRCRRPRHRSGGSAVRVTAPCSPPRSGRRDVEFPVGCPPARRHGIRPRCPRRRHRRSAGVVTLVDVDPAGHDVGIRLTAGTPTGPVVRPGRFAVHLAAG